MFEICACQSDAGCRTLEHSRHVFHQALADGGAGCGRFSILMAKRGCHVTHFDISQPMLDRRAEGVADRFMGGKML